MFIVVVAHIPTLSTSETIFLFNAEKNSLITRGFTRRSAAWSFPDEVTTLVRGDEVIFGLMVTNATKSKWGRQNIELAEDTQLVVCFDGFLVAAEKGKEVLEEENHSNKSSSSPLTDTGISCTLAVERAEETTRQLSVRLRTVNVHCQFVPSRELFGAKVFHSCANNERTT